MSDYLLKRQCYHNELLGEMWWPNIAQHAGQCLTLTRWVVTLINQILHIFIFVEYPFKILAPMETFIFPEAIAFLQPFKVMAVYSPKLYIHCEFRMYISPLSSLPILSYSSLQTLSFEFQAIRLHSSLLRPSTHSAHSLYSLRIFLHPLSQLITISLWKESN